MKTHLIKISLGVFLTATFASGSLHAAACPDSAEYDALPLELQVLNGKISAYNNDPCEHRIATMVKVMNMGTLYCSKRDPVDSISSGLGVEYCEGIAAGLNVALQQNAYGSVNAALVALNEGTDDIQLRSSFATLFRDGGAVPYGEGDDDGHRANLVHPFYFAFNRVMSVIPAVQSATDLATLAVAVQANLSEDSTYCVQEGSSTLEGIAATLLGIEADDLEDDPRVRLTAKSADVTDYVAGLCDMVVRTDDSFENVSRGKIADVNLGPGHFSSYVRHGDDHWLDLIRWFTMAPIEAEACGITKSNVVDLSSIALPTGSCKNLVNESGLGRARRLFLDPEAWKWQIESNGNYQDMFDSANARFLESPVGRSQVNQNCANAPTLKVTAQVTRAGKGKGKSCVIGGTDNNGCVVETVVESTGPGAVCSLEFN